MIPGIIDGFTNVLGAPLGWDSATDGECLPLHVRVTDQGDCQSAWRPTPDELAVLVAGGSVLLSVVGGQPPVWVGVEAA